MTLPQKQQVEINFRPDGSVRTLYDEALDLSSLGDVEIRRGSHVEPYLEGPNKGKWSADMSPVGGPVLGPFEKRSTALQAEHRYLLENWVRPTSIKATNILVNPQTLDDLEKLGEEETQSA